MSLLTCGIDVLCLIVDYMKYNEIVALYVAVEQARKELIGRRSTPLGTRYKRFINPTKTRRESQLEDLFYNLLRACQHHLIVYCRKYGYTCPDKCPSFHFALLHGDKTESVEFVHKMIAAVPLKQSNHFNVQPFYCYDIFNHIAIRKLATTYGEHSLGRTLLASRGNRPCSELTLVEVNFINNNFAAIVTGSMFDINLHTLVIARRTTKGNAMVAALMQLMANCVLYYNTETQRATLFFSLMFNSMHNSYQQYSANYIVNSYLASHQDEDYMDILERLAGTPILQKVMVAFLHQPNCLFKSLINPDTALHRLRLYLYACKKWCPRNKVDIPICTTDPTSNTDAILLNKIVRDFRAQINAQAFNFGHIVRPCYNTRRPNVVYGFTCVTQRCNIADMCADYVRATQLYSEVYKQYIPAIST